jgi:hypothetical protein
MRDSGSLDHPDHPLVRFLGLEGDIGTANVHGARTDGAALFVVQDKTNWMATATARAGYAWGRTLHYVKGGAAWMASRS